MDLKDQLKALITEHENSSEEENTNQENQDGLWIQEDPLLCKFEKRNGKPITLIDNYTGAKKDFKELAHEIKTALGVGGTVKNEQIIIQGDYRPQIMKLLKERGFKVKRVGG